MHSVECLHILTSEWCLADDATMIGSIITLTLLIVWPLWNIFQYASLLTVSFTFYFDNSGNLWILFQDLAKTLWVQICPENCQLHFLFTELFLRLHNIASSALTCEDVISKSLVHHNLVIAWLISHCNCWLFVPKKFGDFSYKFFYLLKLQSYWWAIISNWNPMHGLQVW